MIHIDGKKDEMIANNLMPFVPTHPGEVVKDEIECRGITQRQLSDVTGIAYSVVNEVLNCKRPMTVEYALLMGKALDIDAMPLISMQSEYDMIKAKRSKSLSMRLSKMRKIAAVL
ncbi:MAG: HigA family addiction module antidote protein [Bacteroidales bacterium]|jgi:addiction module HigA family antidote|nr:HigA family addiction module antidote protein [Bacteroidales bacterium]